MIDHLWSQIDRITIDREPSTVTIAHTDGRQASFEPPSLPFPPDSAFRKMNISAAFQRLELETTLGDVVTVELPTQDNLAPISGRPVVYLDQRDWSALFKALYYPET